MGRESNFICETCKVSYYLGYGSYGSWLDRFDSPEEYDAWPDPEGRKNIPKNQNYRRCLGEHSGHDFTTYSSDWTFEHDGNLYMIGGYGVEELWIEGFSSYRKVSLGNGELKEPEQLVRK